MPLFNISYDPAAARRRKKLEELGRTIYDVQTQTMPQAGPVRPGEALPPVTAETPTGLLAQQPEVGRFARAAIETGGPLAQQVVGGLLRQQGFGAGTAAPSAVREYEYFNKLTPEAQKEYLGLKRQGYQITNIGGVPTLTSMIPGQQNIALSTIEKEAAAAAEKEKGKVTGAATGKQIQTGLEQAQKISTNIMNLERVVDLVGEGAETGPIMSKLPSFRAASVQLDNMRRRLGLDVISSVTFGALSEAELNMALDTALPTQLRGPELVRWAREKINAQRKLKDYLEAQAQYLSKPGATQAGWIAEQKKTKAPVDSRDEQALEWARANPKDPRAKRILQIQGVQ